MANGFPPDTVHVNVTFLPRMMGPVGVCCILGLQSETSVEYKVILLLGQCHYNVKLKMIPHAVSYKYVN